MIHTTISRKPLPLTAMTAKNKSLLGQEHTPLVYHFNALAKSYFGSLSAQLNDLDLERYYFVLTLISRHKNISQQALADCIDVDKANMVRILDYLADKGYIKRKVNPKDRREHIITPTKKAEKIATRLSDTFKGVNAEALKGFTKTESKQFFHMMERVFENLSGLPAETYFLKYIKTKETK